ncbi:MAG: cellulose synthase operon protein YhjQ [Succinivibrio sp.]|nr:cellulose synthase operon protein YhjQ [Succinivibrio sp.]
MPVISICSPKGGVGKTTLASNLSYIFSQSGTKVMAVDMDPQNALRLYFGVSLADEGGFIASLDSQAPWLNSALNVGRNLYVLPFGKSTYEMRRNLDQIFINEPDYLKTSQSAIFNAPDLLVIIDFPPGYSEALKAAACITDLYVIPLNADAASVSLLSQIKDGDLFENGESANKYCIVLNQVDNRVKINREIQDFARSNFQDKLAGTVHLDTSVTEAAALQVPISGFNPSSAAAFDIGMLARRLGTMLGFTVNEDTMIISQGQD